MKKPFLNILCLGALAASAQAVTTVSVNFKGDGTNLDPSDSAGAVAATNWNNLTGQSGSANGTLVDSNGATVSGLNLSYSAPGTWTVGTGNADGTAKMFNGYLDVGQGQGQFGQKETVTLTLPFSSFSLYVYSDGDNSNQGQVGRYRVYSGTGTGGAVLGEFWMSDPASTSYRGLVQATTTTWSGSQGTSTYADAMSQVNSATYAQFSGLTASTVTIEALPYWSKFANGTDGWLRAPINGIQIVGVPVPEPRAALLGGLGMLALLRRRRGA